MPTGTDRVPHERAPAPARRNALGLTCMHGSTVSPRITETTLRAAAAAAGPVIDEERVAAVGAMVEQALDKGARLLTRERELPAAGTYVAPALLDDVPDDVDLACREVFGPVAAVFRFHDEEEALARANATETGLAGYVWSRDAARCWRMTERCATGILGINDPLPSVAFAPMGGVRQAGLGREGGAMGLEEFQDVRYIAWRG